jgi:hypothetical protein
MPDIASGSGLPEGLGGPGYAAGLKACFVFTA